MRKSEELEIPVAPETRADDLSIGGDVSDEVAEDFAERVADEFDIPSIR